MICSRSATTSHYLEVLARGALPGATALSQARAAVHDAFWAAARTAAAAQGGPGDGIAAVTRALIEVRLVHRLLPAGAVITGKRLSRALAGGCNATPALAVDHRRRGRAVRLRW